MAIEKEIRIEELPEGHRKITFSKKDRETGVDVQIDKVIIEPSYQKVLLRQLKQESTVFVKFCVRTDEDSENTSEDVEKWEMVIFPMFDRNKEEVSHGSVVDPDDSIVNGNLTIENHYVTDISSNHLDREYHAFQLPILYFAKVWLQNYLDETGR